jgi:tRNA(Ile)-lysidine synthase
MVLTLYEDFLNFISENNLFRSDNRILLAVSGGIDSMAMAHLFLKLETKIGIAHCNFCLRDKESDKDEELVKSFSDKNGVPFYTRRFKTKEYSLKNGISVQMAARELRYTWFEKVRRDNGFDFVAVAHNLNDNIETLLINLIRGTGITGLSGMKPASEKIIRPLLFALRSDIEDYCSQARITFREDSSNAETRYTRNKIRHLVIPLLKEINPSIEETLTETAKKLAGTDEIVTDYVNGIRTQLSVKNGETIIFNIEKLKGLRAGKALIFELFSPFGITGTTSGDLLTVIAGNSGKQIFTKTHRLIRSRNELIVIPIRTKKQENYRINSPEDILMIPGIVSAGIVTRESGFKISDNQNIASIDYDLLKFPLLIRTWESGDYFFPLGMKKKKKLSDYFIDRKYSLADKEKAILLESGGCIVWIIGERLDDRFKVTESTTRIFQVESKNLSDW